MRLLGPASALHASMAATPHGSSRLRLGALRALPGARRHDTLCAPQGYPVPAAPASPNLLLLLKAEGIPVAMLPLPPARVR